MKKSPYEEGYSAGLSAYNYNPYPKDSTEHIEWSEGFEMGLGDWTAALSREEDGGY